MLLNDTLCWMNAFNTIFVLCSTKQAEISHRESKFVNKLWQDCEYFFSKVYSKVKGKIGWGNWCKGYLGKKNDQVVLYHIAAKELWLAPWRTFCYGTRNPNSTQLYCNYPGQNVNIYNQATLIKECGTHCQVFPVNVGRHHLGTSIIPSATWLALHVMQRVN